MKNISVKLIVVIIFLSLYSCVDGLKKEVDPPHTATKPECVVHSYLSSENSRIEVALQWSVPTFNNSVDIDNQIVKNAKVKLLDGTGKFTFLSFDMLSGMYIADSQSYPIKENEKYYLEVEVPNKPKITANCWVPSKLQTSIQNMRIVNTFDSGDPAFYIAFEFDDLPNQKNYYLASFKLTDSSSFYRFKDIKLQILTDTNRDGKKISVRSENILGKINYPQEVTINLFSVDKHFYDYKRTFLQQEESQEMGPFAEPVFIISNINNGLGVFGGYSQISKTETLSPR